MTRPLWFQLIERWVPERMGVTGVTLPFVAGALARTRGQETVGLKELQDCVDEMTRAPVPGFTVEVRQCHNIDWLVLSVSSVEEALPFNGCCLTGPDESPVLGFSQDAQSQFGGLGSSDPNVCKARLVDQSVRYCASGDFSRLREGDGSFGFAPFTAHEVSYIERQCRACGEKI